METPSPPDEVQSNVSPSYHLLKPGNVRRHPGREPAGGRLRAPC